MTFSYITPEQADADYQLQTTYELTTTHPASSNGLPVLRDVATGRIYGAGDRLPCSLLACAADVVERQEYEYTPAADRELIRRFVSRRA